MAEHETDEYGWPLTPSETLSRLRGFRPEGDDGRPERLPPGRGMRRITDAEIAEALEGVRRRSEAYMENYRRQKHVADS